MNSQLVYTIENAILCIMWMVAANLLLESRFSKWVNISVQSAIQIVGWYLFTRFLVRFDAANVILGFLLLTILLVIFNKGNMILKVIVSALIFLTMVISEIVMTMIVPVDAFAEGGLLIEHPVLIYSMFLFVNMTLLCILVISLRAVIAKRKGLLPENVWFMFMLFPVSQCFAFSGWFVEYGNAVIVQDLKRCVPIILLCILSDAGLIQAIRLSARSTELKARNEILAHQIDYENEYYQQMADTYKSMRRIRHDIDNHLYTIKALLEKGATTEAINYANAIMDEDDVRLRWPKCRNTVVASFLEKRVSDIEDAGIRVDADIELPEKINMPDSELICVFGNILDNAQEAVEDILMPSITLSAKYKAPYVTISCVNPLSGESRKKQRVPGLERGIGLTILQNIADRYDGELTAEPQEGHFYTQVILNAGSEDE